MARLKARYAIGYAVDSERVALEILRKSRLVKRARTQLANAAGQSHAPRPHGP